MSEEGPRTPGRALIIHIIRARGLALHRHEKGGRRCCCPFVELSLHDATNAARVVLRFQTQRLVIKNKKDATATAEWNETFSCKPRPREFWQPLSLRCRVWDRDYLRDIPLGETTVPLADFLFSIGSEKRSFRQLEPFGDEDQQPPQPPPPKPAEVERLELQVSLRFTRVAQQDEQVPTRTASGRNTSVSKPPTMHAPRPGSMPKEAPGLVHFPLPRKTLQTSEGEAVSPPRTRTARTPSEEHPGDRAHHIWRHATSLNLARRGPSALPRTANAAKSKSSSPGTEGLSRGEQRLMLAAIAGDDSETVELHLRRTPLSAHSALALCDALRAKPNRTLRVLRLDGCLAAAATSSTTTTAATATAGRDGRTWLQELAAWMSEDAPQCEDLGLSGCGRAVGDAGAEAMAAVLRHGHARLRRLDLARCCVGPRGGAALGEALRSAPGNGSERFQQLLLADNELGPIGCAALGEALRHNATIRELDISGNQLVRYSLTEEGGHVFKALQRLSEALRFNQTLTSLALARNGLCGVDIYGRGESDPSALAAFCNALKMNFVLRKLDLTENPGAAGLQSSFALNARRVETKFDARLARW